MYLAHDDPILLPLSLRRDLVALGHTDRSLAAAVRSGDLARPRRGAYVAGDAWRRLEPDQRYAVTARAAFRQAVAGVVLSHASALPFLGAPLWGMDLRETHLTRTDRLSGRREAGVRRHRALLQDGDVTEAHGLRFTSSLRAAIECCTITRSEAALVVANHFLHRGDFSAQEFAARAHDEQTDRWPDSLALRIVARLADSRIASVGESRTWWHLYERGLPKPVPQYEVQDGERSYFLDFAHPELDRWMEFDGMTKYYTLLRPGESASDVVVREKRREERIAELTGWRCLRLTWTDLAAPDRLEHRIRTFLGLRARSSDTGEWMTRSERLTG